MPIRWVVKVKDEDGKDDFRSFEVPDAYISEQNSQGYSTKEACNMYVQEQLHKNKKCGKDTLPILLQRVLADYGLYARDVAKSSFRVEYQGNEYEIKVTKKQAKSE